MNIRLASSKDRAGIQRVYQSAFSEDEAIIVSELAVELIDENATPPIFSFVAEAAGEIIGHVAFSPVKSDDAENFLGYILAPLAVHPDYQKREVGSQLIAQGMQQISSMEVHVVFVYGDPGYYSRFGFSAEPACQYAPGYPLEYPFGWQAKVLSKYETDKSPLAITCVAPLCDPDLW
ncbi:GNAT family N-acetyltransferase [Amphritea japonica]|uniref:N-acetyltransferase n=1 Tax=Amphritea japonica ATCC BAA-1530 TaxID=1278309 RepID=A0A7R6P566_9GAMM|nr:N-acetyltransferase [Amphritea japonica]BBB26139.1 N-acetyltransferase [Amphritea japonica ATCC BAA-1530]